ncbi:AAA family ATPase [Roseivivax sp. CAU 1761]
MLAPTYSTIRALVPAEVNGFLVDWDGIEGLLPAEFEAMRATPQDPIHHAEGDVLTHTKMVVESLVADEAWRRLPEERRASTFWAAVLHDAGKPATTKREDDGRITSKGHLKAGMQDARRFFMNVGAPFAWREEVCGLIEYHQAPFWLLERDDPVRKAVSISYACNTADLCLYARHDILGRVCQDSENVLANVALAEMQFADAGCLGKARHFQNDASRVEYLVRPDRYVDYVAHEEYRSSATLMCGLPGAGKDTWIAQNAAHAGVVSLDDLRIEMGVSPDDNQGPVVQAGKERARQYLRAGEDFVWNATNVTRQKRSELLELFRDYGAHTSIVYIEPSLDVVRSQNRGRPDQVPEKPFERMLAKLEPPRRDEAHELICVIG